MFRHTVPLGRIFGIVVDLDYSWFLVFGLLTWILAVSYYPAEFTNWSSGEYWLMGAVTAIMLFVSVLLHELGHSVVAKRFGIPVPRITLFIFGGVSEIAAEPPSAGVEFWIAAVGPLVSFALATLFWELEPLVAFSSPLLALTKYLALLNLVLGAFNLLPGFPLDGGRVLRAFVWRVTSNYQRATAVAAVTGRFFGFFLIFMGVWQALAGNFIGGLWIAFIGWFLESAAGSQLQQEALKSLIGEHRVLDAMKQDFLQISGDVTLQELVDKHVLPGGARCFVVSDASGLTGMVTFAGIRGVSRSAWPTTTASQVMVPVQKLVTIRPDARLWSALEKMGRNGVNQLPVVDGNGIVGMLSREDILHYLGVLREFGT
ncbi:MAG: site-2 protease family protein [Acidobacteriia bacterium]|nr:site-2 protease family protein [Terriglobia bacterium]